MNRGTNNERVSGFNETVIVDAIRRSPSGISRVELSRVTGLSQQGISKLVRRVLESGLVSETGTKVKGPGKPPTVLKLEPMSRFAIGVHIDPASISLVVLNFLGEIVGRSRISLRDTPTPAAAVTDMSAGIEDLITSHSIPRDRILGVGIASPGPIDEVDGKVLGPAQLKGWESVPLRTAVHQATGLAVLLDKDVTASAVAELWSGKHKRHRSFAVIYLGTGVGLGLVMNNQVVRGDFHNAGEIGHLYSGQETPVDTCGRSGCLGLLVEPLSIVTRGIEAGLLRHPDNGPLDHARIEQLFETLAQMARGGEPRSSAIIDDVAAGLGRVIVDIANLLDLDRVVLGGPFWPAIEQSVMRSLQPSVANELVAKAIHQVEVVGSSLGSEIGAIGAGCLILDNLYSPRAQSLLLLEDATIPPGMSRETAQLEESSINQLTL